MSKPNPESFISSNNLNISSSMSENQNLGEQELTSSLKNLIIPQQGAMPGIFSPKRNVLNLFTNKKLSSPTQSQIENVNTNTSPTSNFYSTAPSHQISSFGSNSSNTNKGNSKLSFKNQIVEPYLHREPQIQFNKEIYNEESKRGNLSDLDCSLTIERGGEEERFTQKNPADFSSQTNQEIENIKSTFDDLMKRKSEKEMVLKKQIEINKKSLLDKFFNNNLSSSYNSIQHEKDNNTNNEQNKENEQLLPTIYEFNITENSKLEYDETRAISSANDNNMNNNSNYISLKEKYKNERNKKKSSIFKSEDLRVSKTDVLNLKQSDILDNKKEENFYSPINADNININQNNIVIIQKKLFESSNELNEYESNSSNTSDVNSNRKIQDTGNDLIELDDQSAFDINNISIKEQIVFSIEKAFNFCIEGKKKTPQKQVKHIDRNNRILSMEIVAKLDYDLSNINNNANNNVNNKPPKEQNKNILNTAKHNKTSSNIITMKRNTNKNNLILHNQNSHSKTKSNNIFNYIDNKIISPKPKIKEFFNSHKTSFIEGINKGNTYRNNSLKKKNSLPGNVLFHTNLFPSTTKNKPVSIKFIRTSSAQKYIGHNIKNNKNATLNTLSHNNKIKYNKLVYQVEAISKVKKLNLSDKLVLIFVEKMKDNLNFKGLFEYSLQKKGVANKLFSIGILPTLLSLDNYDIFIEIEPFIYEPINKISELYDKTILVMKKNK